MKVRLNKNSLRMQGVMDFLFKIYPDSSYGPISAKKYLKSTYNSEFEVPLCVEIFGQLRTLVSKEMVRR